jgi:hypothetical protein
MRVKTIGRSAVRILLITIVLALMVAPTACSESTSGTSVSIAIADREVKQGESFTVEARISTDTPCRGAQCVLSFDTSLLRCDSTAEGDFLKDWATGKGGSTVVLPATIDNVQGRVSGPGIAIMGGGEGGAKGSGVLLTYHFTALADGTAEPTLSSVVLADDSGQAIAEVEVNN